MSTALLVAICAGGVSLLSAIVAVVGVVFTGLNARKIEEMKTASEAHRDAKDRAREMAIYSAPLASAAFDLQSRLYNLLKKNFATVYIQGGSPRERAYGIDNTTFLIAQFFCWSELTRTEIHYIELQSDDDTRKLLRLQDRLYTEWATDCFASTFRIFSGEQRAIGEALIIGPPEYTTCMGYGAFLAAFPTNANHLIDELRAEVDRLDRNLETARPRLTQLHHTLLEVLDLFDPEAIRFPIEGRSRT
jgi:hypothetical protein